MREYQGCVLFAAFPLLLGLLLVLLALGVPGGLVLLVGILAWLGGPVLAAEGVVMLWRQPEWGLAPSTRDGWLSLTLLGVSAVAYLAFWTMLELEVGPDDAETFGSNLYLATPLMLAGGCAIAAGIVAAFALFVRRERSPFVIVTLVIGVFVALVVDFLA